MVTSTLHFHLELVSKQHKLYYFGEVGHIMQMILLVLPVGNVWNSIDNQFNKLTFAWTTIPNYINQTNGSGVLVNWIIITIAAIVELWAELLHVNMAYLFKLHNRCLYLTIIIAVQIAHVVQLFACTGNWWGNRHDEFIHTVAQNEVNRVRDLEFGSQRVDETGGYLRCARDPTGHQIWRVDIIMHSLLGGQALIYHTEVVDDIRVRVLVDYYVLSPNVAMDSLVIFQVFKNS